MSSLPFAYVGVSWLLYVSNTSLNMMAIIGITLLVGIVVNNGIVMIDHINNHRRRGKRRNQAIIDGGMERLRPILMTALTTILGLIPLAFGQTQVGGTTYYPLALAVIGGLASSTFLTLLVLPALYLLVDDMGNYLKNLFLLSSFRYLWSRRKNAILAITGKLSRNG